MASEDEWADRPDEEPPSDVHEDPEAPEGDTLDQRREVAPTAWRGEISRAPDAPEGDAIDQAIEVPLDAEDDADS